MKTSVHHHNPDQNKLSNISFPDFESSKKLSVLQYLEAFILWIHYSFNKFRMFESKSRSFETWQYGWMNISLRMNLFMHELLSRQMASIPLSLLWCEAMTKCLPPSWNKHIKSNCWSEKATQELRTAFNNIWAMLLFPMFPLVASACPLLLSSLALCNQAIPHIYSWWN